MLYQFYIRDVWTSTCRCCKWSIFAPTFKYFYLIILFNFLFLYYLLLHSFRFSFYFFFILGVLVALAICILLSLRAHCLGAPLMVINIYLTIKKSIWASLICNIVLMRFFPKKHNSFQGQCTEAVLYVHVVWIVKCSCFTCDNFRESAWRHWSKCIKKKLPWIPMC